MATVIAQYTIHTIIIHTIINRFLIVSRAYEHYSVDKQPANLCIG